MDTPNVVLDPVLDADRERADPEVDELLHGAIDFHVHPGPSPLPRRISIYEAAQDAAGAGFRAVVVKSHHLSMQTDVMALQSVGLGKVPIDVFAGIALNRTTGGFNAYAVELVLKLGGRVVWFPTISSHAHADYHHEHHDSKFPVPVMPLRANVPLSIFGEDGKITAEVHDVLSVIAEQKAVLNMGHLPRVEIESLIPAARSAGIERMVVSHPDFIVGARPEDTIAWAKQGAIIEHCAAMLGPLAKEKVKIDQRVFAAYLSAVGDEHTILSSDLGQVGNPLPVTAYRQVVREMLDYGVPSESVRRIVGGNAARLLYGDHPLKDASSS